MVNNLERKKLYEDVFQRTPYDKLKNIARYINKNSSLIRREASIQPITYKISDCALLFINGS